MSPTTPRPLNGNNRSLPNGVSTAAKQPSNPLKRPRSPGQASDTPSASEPNGMADDKAARDERRQALLRDLYARSERMLHRLYHSNQQHPLTPPQSESPRLEQPMWSSDQTRQQHHAAPKAKRPVDEDDYGDDSDDDEEEGQPAHSLGGPALKVNAPAWSSTSPSKPTPSSTLKPPLDSHDATKLETSEDVRKRLEEEKKVAEDLAKESFQTMFYTLENDHDAMAEQQKLDELDRQVEHEMSGSANTAPGPEAKGSLSTTNLGASSLTLKHLFARIDANRSQVQASDAKLRSLISEVRKNRSKWASEDRVGQEELYEAAERVLMELKGMTEYAAPFLTKVKRLEAPDYHKIIKDPMDLGTMLKKLSKAQYDSKKDFCNDLNLIWSNCLTYNDKPDHPLRKKAIHMQKETTRLVPLIPDIIIRDRKDIEREEQQLEQLDENAGSESDEDDRPIAATRGRKAPSKSSKGTGSARKAPPGSDDANDADIKMKPTPAPVSAIRQDQLKSDQDPTDGGHLGFSTPPPGTLTPLGLHGHTGSAAPASHADHSDIEAINSTAGATTLPAEEPDEEDEEYRIWKRVTKKDRARVAAERHRLFRGDKLNVDEPALLRTKRAMRRWTKQQSVLSGRRQSRSAFGAAHEEPEEDITQGALAEDMSNQEESTLPDYYEPLAGIPQIDSRLEWEADPDGSVNDRREDCLRLLPPSYFSSPVSELSSRLDRNMRQMQETRKIVAKIGIVKQMQQQMQTYQNQFQKYAPEPFLEADAEPTVVSDDGPFMSSSLSRAALQRSVAKVFYAAGFEDFQPSAMEAITDIAGDFFIRLVQTLKMYTESHKVSTGTSTSEEQISETYRAQFAPEAAVLHTLLQNGLDLNEMEAYVSETCNSLPSKLETHHTRMRDYYAELVRPALDPNAVGSDGAGAFQDGNEAQFVAGDFAEELGEDFFGFKELGLDIEFGISNMSIPLHLLQARISSLQQNPEASVGTVTGIIMETPMAYPSITADSLEDELGIVQEYFRERLEKTEDGRGPLVEDEELPAKQRFPKPRLPPNGKISSPRKRPLREQQMLARKRKRAEIEAERQREREQEEANNPIAATAAAGSSGPGDSESTAKVPRLSNAGTRDADGELDVGDISLTNGVAPANSDLTLTNGEPAGNLKLEPSGGASATPAPDPEKKRRKESKSGAKPSTDSAQPEDGTAEDADGEKDERILSPSVPIAAH